MRSQTKILVIAFPCVTGGSYFTCNCRPGLMDFMIGNLLQALILEFAPRVLGQQHRISLPIDNQLLCSWCHARGCRFCHVLSSFSQSPGDAAKSFISDQEEEMTVRRRSL
jgi:hypothetical protein